MRRQGRRLLSAGLRSALVPVCPAQWLRAGRGGPGGAWRAKLAYMLAAVTSWRAVVR